jgi:hypothetical protein
MIISRIAAENALLNKHGIKRYIGEGKPIRGLPLVDSKNPATIEKTIGTQLRVLKDYSPGFDFTANIIAAAHSTGNPGEYIKDVDENYYKIRVSEKQWKQYFQNCGDHTIRQSLARQVFKDFQTGFVILPIYDKVLGKGIEKRAPFRIMAEQYYSDGTNLTLYRELFFSKAVFGSLVTGDCAKKGGDGFVEIPANLYPILTGTDKGKLASYNPVYKLNIHALMKNTHKKDHIEVQRQELLETIAPEYLDNNGYLRITAADLHDSLVKSTQESLSKIPSGLLVKNLFIGKHGGKSTIYFRE